MLGLFSDYDAQGSAGTHSAETRSSRTLAVLLSVFLGQASLAAPAFANASAPAEADYVLSNGRVLTVNATDAIAEAVAIKDGRILAVGSNADVAPHAGMHTHRIDLHGRTVTPGLIDTHFHFSETEALNELDLSASSRIEEVQQLIARKVATLRPGEWVRGSGWDEGKLAELRYIYASDLDEVAPDNPVWLTHTTGHYGVASSRALKLAAITRRSKAPPAGTIDRDAQGRPTGVLKESAMDLIWRLIPPYSHEQQRAGLLKAVADANREGMTGIKDPGIDQEKWDLYREALAADELSVHVLVLWLAGRELPDARKILDRMAGLPKPPRGLGDDILLSGGVKLYMDGSGGARTGWLYREWNKNYDGVDAGNFGYPTIEPAIYPKLVKLFHDAGYSVGTHAVGDRAIDLVVDTYAAVLKENPVKGLRHSIIHANVPTEHAIATMAALQKQYDAAYPESQPTFLWWIGDTYAANYGRERALRLNPLESYQERGVIWSGGSDYPVTPFPARFGLWASIARRPLKGIHGAQPFGTAEAVDARTALRSYTIWAARQLFLEKRTGSIEVGKDADLAVWDRDIDSIPTDDIKEMKCELTMFRGRIVHRAEKTALTETTHE